MRLQIFPFFGQDGIVHTRFRQKVPQFWIKLPYEPEAIQGIQTNSIPATLGGLGQIYGPFPPLCPVCEAYGTLFTHTTKNPVFWQDILAWLTPLPPRSWGAKTELLAHPELELLTRPFKVRRLIVRPTGGHANLLYFSFCISGKKRLRQIYFA